MAPRSWRACSMLLAATLLGCSGDAQVAPPGMSSQSPVLQAVAAPDDDAALILPDVMDLLIDPAAGVLLAAADQHAWAGLQARSDEAWQAVGDAAAQLLQASDMLAAPVLARGRADWLQWTGALREGAGTAGAAARRHDPRGLYLAGVQVRTSCQACHARYATQAAEPLAWRQLR